MGTETFQVYAKVTREPERTRLFNKILEAFPGFDDYYRRTDRVLLAIVLTLVDKHRPDVNVWAMNTKPALQAKFP